MHDMALPPVHYSEIKGALCCLFSSNVLPICMLHTLHFFLVPFYFYKATGFTSLSYMKINNRALKTFLNCIIH